MTQYEIEQEIEKQEADLEMIMSCDEETACFLFNADSKAELLKETNKEIRFYESLLKPDDDEDEDGMDYDAICATQGLSRYTS